MYCECECGADRRAEGDRDREETRTRMRSAQTFASSLRSPLPPFFHSLHALNSCEAYSSMYRRDVLSVQIEEEGGSCISQAAEQICWATRLARSAGRKATRPAATVDCRLSRPQTARGRRSQLLLDTLQVLAFFIPICVPYL